MITADYFLEGLNEIGVEYIFSNFGTDHAPIIEAMARWRQAGRHYPQVIVCPHENVATAMAMGFAQCTGRGQAVLVHTDVGTANAAMGIMNACRSRVPILLIAGKTPFVIHGELPGGRNIPVHFLQDTRDMGSIVRPYVKWEYTLPSGVVVKEVTRRAHTMMQSDPQGPVFLMLPREILAESWPEEKIVSFPAEQYGPYTATGVEDSLLEEVADHLLAAANPILITSYAGRNRNAPAVIAEFAQLAGIKVYESNPTALNIAHDSPCFFGFSAESELARADLGLMVDVDIPWIPSRARLNPDLHWVHIDVDAVKKDIPMWGFPSHTRLQGDSTRILCRLRGIVQARRTDAQRSKVERRLSEFVAAKKSRDAETALRSRDSAPASGIDPGFLCSELNKAIAPDDILINETIKNTPAVVREIQRTVPGTYLASGGSGLGYGGGAALGVKLANPDRTVFHLTGDGSFYFSDPSAVYEVSQRYGLPVLTVIFDNGGWAAVKESVKLLYPDGASAASNQFQALIDPAIAFEKMGEAAGAHGERVTESKELPAAIQRCLKIVKEGRAAILNVRLSGELIAS